MIEQHAEVRKISIGQVDDYATGCLLDYSYLKDNFRLIPVDVSNALDALDAIAIQQRAFQGIAGQKLRLCTILEKSKETVL